MVSSFRGDHQCSRGRWPPLLRQPGCQARGLTRGFASPSRDGFAFFEKGSSCPNLRARGVPSMGPIRVSAPQTSANGGNSSRCDERDWADARNEQVSSARRLDTEQNHSDIANLRIAVLSSRCARASISCARSACGVELNRAALDDLAVRAKPARAVALRSLPEADPGPYSSVPSTTTT